MPFKDVLKRRAAHKKWRTTHKEKWKSYQKILLIAKKHNPVPKKCKVRGCKNIGERHHPDYSKPKLIEWICRFHHRRIEHASYCKLCGGKITGRGLCSKHYKQYRLRTEPEFHKKKMLYQKRWREKKKSLLSSVLE